MTSASTFHSKIQKSVENVSSGTQQKHNKIVLERNVLAEHYRKASESVQMRLIDDLSYNKLPFFILEEVINEIKTESKELISDRKIQISQNVKEFAVSYNHTKKPMIFKVQITGLSVFKSLECLNYNLYFLCSRVVAVAEDTGNLGIVSYRACL